MLRKAKGHALDRLPPECFGSRAGQGLALNIMGLNIMGLNISALPPCIFMSKKGPGSPESEQNGERKGGEPPFRKQPHARDKNRTVLQRPIPPNLKKTKARPLPPFVRQS
jgi:hypothetical protein